ncbi:MAG: TIGR04211 family SH3 domain-containing protein [Desulfatiglandaceae bacterium]
MKRLCLTILMVFGFMMASHICWAEKAYVSNRSKITLRKGPGVKHEIITMLSVDEPVEIVGSKSGWKQVRLLDPDRKHMEGWVVSRYLVNRVPWKTQTLSLKEENSRLKARLAAIEKRMQTTSSERDELSRNLSKSDATLTELQQKYDALVKEASDYLELKEAHETMKSELTTARNSVERLTTENVRLKSSERNRWFLSGSAVLLVGLIIGLVMGRQQKRRKSSYY